METDISKDPTGWEDQPPQEDNPMEEPAPPAPRPPDRNRFEFDVTEDIAPSDLLIAQLGECTRMIRSLSDRVLSEPLEVHERTHTIASVADVVNCSGKLAEWWDRLLHQHGWYTAPPAMMPMTRPRRG